MKINIYAFYLLPGLGAAFPGLGPDFKENILREAQHRPRAQEAAELDDRGVVDGLGNLVGGALSAVLEDVGGLLGSVAATVDPDNRRPEPGYQFQEPGPNDSRGPCPGLNLLANHGYLPRNGHVSMAQVIDATARGFNMAADLVTILTVFAILTDGDPVTETWYLGSGPNNVGGLNRHSTVEADISPNREDYYNGCGDNHHLSSRMFKQNVKFAAQSESKQFDFGVMAQQYAANADFTKKHNPYVYFFPFPSIVSIAAFNFYSAFFSNGTYGAGGVANYESISSIIGAKLDEETGEFEYVPERWPENWYRRATPYEAVQALLDGFTQIYSANPVFMPIGQLGTANLNVSTLLCDAYQGVNSILPLAIAPEFQVTSSTISWALGNLAGLGLSDTALGCPQSTISTNFLYPDANVTGGPLNAPPGAEQTNEGNNVYHKTYFCQAPVQPQCGHVC